MIVRQSDSDERAAILTGAARSVKREEWRITAEVANGIVIEAARRVSGRGLVSSDTIVHAQFARPSHRRMAMFKRGTDAGAPGGLPAKIATLAAALGGLLFWRKRKTS